MAEAILSTYCAKNKPLLMEKEGRKEGMFICFLLLKNKLQQALMTSNKTYLLLSTESLEAHMGCTGFSAQHLSKLESRDEFSKILERAFLQMLIQVLGRISSLWQQN